MSVLTAIRQLLPGRRKAGELTLTDARGWQWIGEKSTSGLFINDDLIYQVTALYSAIRLIAESICTMPVNLYQKTSSGRVLADQHHLFKKIHGRPNRDTTKASFMQQIAVSLVVWNQSYVLAPRVGRRVGQMHVIATPNVQPFEDANEVIRYRVTLNGKQRVYDLGEIIPIRGFGAAGMLEGFRLSSMHKNAIALTAAAERFGAKFFDKGARPSGFLVFDQFLTPDQRSQSKKWFEEQISGLENAHGVGVLEGGVKWAPVSGDPGDSQLNDTRMFQVKEIARITRVPPYYLMEEIGIKYDGIEQAGIHLLKHTLLPYLTYIEEALNEFLLEESDREKGFYVEFNPEGLLRGDSAGRAEYYTKMRDLGTLTRNEIRAKENMPPMLDDFADEAFMPLNMAPISMYRERVKQGNTGTSTQGGQDGNKDGTT